MADPLDTTLSGCDQTVQVWDGRQPFGKYTETARGKLNWHGTHRAQPLQPGSYVRHLFPTASIRHPASLNRLDCPADRNLSTDSFL